MGLYIYVYIYIYIRLYIYIWAADVIWYKTQLTGCSYLVLQSRHVLGGLTSFSNAALVFNSQMLYVRCLPRSRGVPTSFYRLIMIFLTNRGTPQYYSLFNQIKSVAHMLIHFRKGFFKISLLQPNWTMGSRGSLSSVHNRFSQPISGRCVRKPQETCIRFTYTHLQRNMCNSERKKKKQYPI